MKVNYYEDLALSENRVDVYYREQDAEIRGLMDYLETEQVIVGRKDQTAKRIYLREIYYLEIVDRHCLPTWTARFFRSSIICGSFSRNTVRAVLSRSASRWW